MVSRIRPAELNRKYCWEETVAEYYDRDEHDVSIISEKLLKPSGLVKEYRKQLQKETG